MLISHELETRILNINYLLKQLNTPSGFSELAILGVALRRSIAVHRFSTGVLISTPGSKRLREAINCSNVERD
jgi:hypothetical protein